MKKLFLVFLCFAYLSPVFSTEAGDEKSKPIKNGLAKFSSDFLIQVASLQEDGLSKPFNSGGLLVLLSIPLTQLGKNFWLHGQVGTGVNYLGLTINQPDTAFSRLSFPFPVLLRLLKAMNRSITGEVFGGVIYRPFFYDSRDNTSGGFQSVKEGVLKPEVGFGFRFFLSPNVRLNTRASFFYLACGIEWLL